MFHTAERLRIEMVDETLAHLTRSELCDRVELASVVKSALAAFEARLCRAIDELDDAGVDGAGVLRTVGRVSAKSAAASANLAEGLAGLPLTTAALSAGRITSEHAASVVRAADKVSPDQADAELVERAAACPADVFGKNAREWIVSKSEPDDGKDELARQQAQRQAVFWDDDEGLLCFLAKFDPITGNKIRARVRQRYDQLFRDDGGRDGSPDTVRSPEQRMADAVTDIILESGVRASGTTAAPHPKAQLLISADLGRLTTENPHGAAQVLGHGAIPQNVLEQLACNSEMVGVLFDGPGRPIWVGRDHRTATNAQWKALIARDRGCVGCGADPSRCEAHHIIPWKGLGPTDITNLVLVCCRCHHDLHDRGATLHSGGDGRFHIDHRAGPLILAV